MKLEHLIVQHLYKAKSVTLQGIGTIHLDPAIAIPEDTEKNTAIPENAFSFDYNLKAGEDAALIEFIMQQTRKIRPLASSDLESYCILSRQFLNIGKPLTIEGVGTLLKTQDGMYEFTAGHFISPKVEDIPRQLREKEDAPVSFEHDARSNKGGNRKVLLFLFFLLFAGLAGLGLYYFMFKNKPAKTEIVQETVLPVTDTVAKTADSSVAALPDSAATLPVVGNTVRDSNSFKLVIKEYTTEAAANKAFERFTKLGYTLTTIRVDSAKFQLAIPFNLPLSDTTRVKDSLRVVFPEKLYIIKP